MVQRSALWFGLPGRSLLWAQPKPELPSLASGDQLGRGLLGSSDKVNPKYPCDESKHWEGEEKTSLYGRSHTVILFSGTKDTEEGEPRGLEV